MKNLKQATDEQFTLEELEPVKTIYESGSGYFSLEGNNNFRTGWKPTKLGLVKQTIILAALSDSWVDKVYRRENRGYKLLLNGVEVGLW